MKRLSPPLRTTLIYGFFGLCWIVFSDRLLAALSDDPHLLSHLQSLKGMAYVVITSFLLYVLMRRDYARIVAQEEEKRRLFVTTMRAVQHILNNFLQSMSLFALEAKSTPGFRPEAIELFDKVIFSTRDEIVKLSSIEQPSEEEIQRTVYPR